VTSEVWVPQEGYGAVRSRHSALFWIALGVVVAVVVTAVSAVALLSTRYRAFTSPSASMRPTLGIGDHMLVRRTQDVHDGDLVVFDGRDSFDDGLPTPTEHDYVKRVIALGGEHVHETPSQVVVDGVVRHEPYLLDDGATDPQTDTFDLVVPTGRMWVLGDNRADSADSRYHSNDDHHGTVAVSDVVGVVVRHGSRAHTYGLPLEQGAVVGLGAGAVTAGAGLLRRRTLDGP